MTVQSKINMNLDGLEGLVGGLKDYVARVGVLSGKNIRQSGEPAGNADIGLIQEMGSESAGIPARSWLRLPIETKERDLIKQVGDSKMVAKAVDAGDVKKVFAIIGIEAEAIIQDAFATGGFGQWAPNAPATIAAKGSSQPLIDTTQLRRSVTSDVARRSEI